MRSTYDAAFTTRAVNDLYIENPLAFNAAGHILVGYVTRKNIRPADTYEAMLFEADAPGYPAESQPACKMYQDTRASSLPVLCALLKWTLMLRAT